MHFETVLFNQLVASAAKHNKPEYIYNPAGQIVNVLKERKPARRIVEEIVEQADEVLRRLQGDIKA
jgi:hypothetical protein